MQIYSNRKRSGGNTLMLWNVDTNLSAGKSLSYQNKPDIDIVNALEDFILKPSSVSLISALSMCVCVGGWVSVLGSGWEDLTAVLSWVWLQLKQQPLTAAEHTVRVTAAQFPVHSQLSNSLCVFSFPPSVSLWIFHDLGLGGWGWGQQQIAKGCSKEKDSENKTWANLSAWNISKHKFQHCLLLKWT